MLLSEVWFGSGCCAADGVSRAAFMRFMALFCTDKQH